ncbi:MAG TPA: hypothetical protein PLN21_10355 [Gemmatales bacterium]|nr:hypothetical protein [Gemmatales bacterium]
MNPASPISFSPNMIFVIVAVLIVLAMMMGRKNRTTHRTSFGWWIGLGVLLFIGSGFIFFARSGSGATIEVRHSVRSAINEMKNQIRTGAETVRDSLEQGLDEMSKGVDQVQGTIGSLGSSDSKSKGKKKSSTTAPIVAKITAPTAIVSWTVEVKDKDRKQKKEEVDKLLHSKATISINRWLTERMPVKNIDLNVVTTPWLQERGVFSEPIEYQTQEVPRVNTSETDPLIGGTLKVILTPTVQESLLDLGYEQVNTLLKSDQFQAQWIITTILLGITGFVAILGLVKTVVTRRVSGYAAQPVS